jgi:transcriptional regulator with GAF, ATPase, and Fis domain
MSGSIKVDVRIIAATNRDLEAAVRKSAFREDLFYRLNVFPITIPPLRERDEDIPALAWAFVEELSRTFGKRIEAIASHSLNNLQRYPWPGNVRELRNVIERAIILAKSSTLTPTVPCVPLVPSSTPSTRLVDVQTPAYHVGAGKLRLARSRNRRRRRATRLETYNTGDLKAKLGISRPQ